MHCTILLVTTVSSVQWPIKVTRRENPVSCRTGCDAWGTVTRDFSSCYWRLFLCLFFFLFFFLFIFYFFYFDTLFPRYCALCRILVCRHQCVFDVTNRTPAALSPVYRSHKDIAIHALIFVTERMSLDSVVFISLKRTFELRMLLFLSPNV